MSNLMIIHGGGPTAVINASLYGVLTEAKKQQARKVYAARGGTGGLLKGQVCDLLNLTDGQIAQLLQTPGSAIGSSRDALSALDYERMLDVLKQLDINAVLVNGGNGSMDMAYKLHLQCEKAGIHVMGVPKTMDNDLPATDHSPGFGSAARFIANAVAEICCDIASMPIHITVIETLGRNAGWLTAATALAVDSGFGPDLVYVPERLFDEVRFLDDCQKLIARKGHGVIVAAEGLKNLQAQPLVKPSLTQGRTTYYGNVAAYLSELITSELGFKARNEKPGLLIRSSMALVSRTDRAEAVEVGKMACRLALQGECGKMLGFRRLSNQPYRCELVCFPLAKVRLKEQTLPLAFINEEGNHIRKEFNDWCRPLIGEPLVPFLNLTETGQ